MYWCNCGSKIPKNIYYCQALALYQGIVIRRGTQKSVDVWKQFWELRNIKEDLTIKMKILTFFIEIVYIKSGVVRLG